MKSGHPSSKHARLAASIVAGAVLTFWPFHLNDGRFDERLRLSKVLMNHGEFDAARVELAKALTIEPANTVVEFNLGVAEVSSHRPDEGLAHLRHSIDAGVPVAGARYALANALVATGNTAEGGKLLRSFSPQPDDDAESCIEVAKLAVEARIPEVAERFLIRAEELQPDRPELVQLLESIRRR